MIPIKGLGDENSYHFWYIKWNMSLRKHISGKSTEIQLCYWGVSFFDLVSFRSCSHTDYPSVLGLAPRGFERGSYRGHSGDRRLRGPPSSRI